MQGNAFNETTTIAQTGAAFNTAYVNQGNTSGDTAVIASKFTPRALSTYISSTLLRPSSVDKPDK